MLLLAIYNAALYNKLEENQQIVLSLTERNEELHKKLNALKAENAEQSAILTELKTYKDKVEEQEQRKLEIKEKRKNKEEEEPKDPIYYSQFILLMTTLNENLIVLNKEPMSYHLVQSLKLYYLLSFGGRITEIRTLTLDKLCMAYYKGFLPIKVLKGGPSGHNAYFFDDFKELMKDYRSLFKYIFTIYQVNPNRNQSVEQLKQLYSKIFIFSSQISKGKKPYSRSYFNDLVNKTLQTYLVGKEEGIRYTSHSFRHGYITQFYNNTHDLILTATNIGHKNSTTTQHYIEKVTEKERKNINKDIKFCD